jgi:hypothetical protein
MFVGHILLLHNVKSTETNNLAEGSRMYHITFRNSTKLISSQACPCITNDVTMSITSVTTTTICHFISFEL